MVERQASRISEHGIEGTVLAAVFYSAAQSAHSMAAASPRMSKVSTSNPAGTV